MYWSKHPWVYSDLTGLLSFGVFLVAVTSAPPAELTSSQYSITQYQRNTMRCLQCWTCDQHNHKVTELHPSEVPHPTDRRGECHNLIPLHIFSTVIAAPRLTEAKAYSYIVRITFYQLAAGRSDPTLPGTKNWTKKVCLNIKLARNFIKVFMILFLPVSSLAHT